MLGTTLLVFISFVLFMFAMRAAFFEPIRQIKAAREDKIKADTDAALQLKASAQNLSETYQASLTEARKQAQKLIIERRQQAKARAGETIAAAKQTFASTLEEAMKSLAQSREDAYQSLQSDRDQLTQLVVSKITQASDKIPAGSHS